MCICLWLIFCVFFQLIEDVLLRIAVGICLWWSFAFYLNLFRVYCSGYLSLIIFCVLYRHTEDVLLRIAVGICLWLIFCVLFQIIEVVLFVFVSEWCYFVLLRLAVGICLWLKAVSCPLKVPGGAWAGANLSLPQYTRTFFSIFFGYIIFSLNLLKRFT